MKRKILCALLITITASSLITGCGKKKNQTQEAGTNIQTETVQTAPVESAAPAAETAPAVEAVQAPVTQAVEQTPAVQTAPAGQTSSDLISQEEARKIALDFTKLNEADVRITKEKLDNDDGYMLYEIEFINDTTEYEFEIDAKSGDILSYSTDSVFD